MCRRRLRISGLAAKGRLKAMASPGSSAIKAYAAAHDLKIAHEFREERVSGSVETMDGRAWAEIVATLHSKGVKTIVVEKLDRVARDLMVQEACVADLRKRGFELISVQEPDLMANDPRRVFDAVVGGRSGAIRQVSDRSEAPGRADAHEGENRPLRRREAVW
jgi:hypothetical protein